MATRTAVKRIGFINQTDGWLGAVKVNRKGDEVGVPVAPGERVFLTPEEVTLTEQSHVRAEDSPFIKKHIVHTDIRTGDIIKEFDGEPLARIPEKTAAG